MHRTRAATAVTVAWLAALTMVAFPGRARATANDRFRPVASGVIVDLASGLEWTRTDNGRDLDWATARRYCAGLRLGRRDGWRLPVAAELLGLTDALGRDKTDCSVNGERFTCSVSPLFRLSSVVQWSADAAPLSGDPQAWDVHLGAGAFKMFDTAADTGHFRALCVRRP